MPLNFSVDSRQRAATSIIRVLSQVRLSNWLPSDQTALVNLQFK